MFTLTRKEKNISNIFKKLFSKDININIFIPLVKEHRCIHNFDSNVTNNIFNLKDELRKRFFIDIECEYNSNAEKNIYFDFNRSDKSRIDIKKKNENIYFYFLYRKEIDLYKLFNMLNNSLKPFMKSCYRSGEKYV